MNVNNLKEFEAIEIITRYHNKAPTSHRIVFERFAYDERRPLWLLKAYLWFGRTEAPSAWRKVADLLDFLIVPILIAIDPAMFKVVWNAIVTWGLQEQVPYIIDDAVKVAFYLRTKKTDASLPHKSSDN